MSKEISKSPEVLEKEGKIKALQKELKKTHSTLKSLKTRLSKSKEKVDNYQRKFSGEFYSLSYKADEMRLEIIRLFDELKKIKGLTKEDLEGIEFIQNDFRENTLGEEFETYKAQREQMEAGEFDFKFEENHRAKMKDIFSEFEVKPDANELKNIRKIFIGLSTRFHPDKAQNEKQRAKHHELMQEINEAYQAGDTARLLEIERLNSGLEDSDFISKAGSIDVLTQAIKKLEEELAFIKNQIKRTSGEIKNLRESDLGAMLTGMKKADQEGEGIDSMIEGVKEGLEQMTKVRDIIKECIETKSMDPMTELMLSMAGEQSGLDLMDMLSDDNIDLSDPNTLAEFLSMMGEPPGAEYEVENPVFPVGTSVKVAANAYPPMMRNIDMKNWQGRVEKIYNDGRDDIYRMRFDSQTIKAMPKKYIELIFDEEEEFGYAEFPANMLKKTKPRDTETATRIAQRTVFHNYYWMDFDMITSNQMPAILLKHPEKTDAENWRIHLEKVLKLPLKGFSRGHYRHPPGFKIEVLQLHEWHDAGGWLVLVKKDGFVMDHPLEDIDVKGKYEDLLDSYSLWWEHREDYF